MMNRFTLNKEEVLTLNGESTRFPLPIVAPGEDRGNSTQTAPLSAEKIYQALAQSLTPPPLPASEIRLGYITKVNASLLTASLPGVMLGELCLISPAIMPQAPSHEPTTRAMDQQIIGDGQNNRIEAEVIAIDRDCAILSPFSDPIGLAVGDIVRPLGKIHQIAVGNHLLGSIVDGLGRTLRGTPAPVHSEQRALENSAPNPLTRKNIDTVLPLGVRALDGLLSCGIGQRMGIFAAAGGGKSTLLGMISANTQADIIVLALIGERGREVREFLEQTLDPKTLSRAVLVIATSDRPAIERLKAAYTATVIAEYFRDQGKNVLLVMDSLTRFARAARDIGMAAGEPLSAGGGAFPPSLYARLPRLLERAGYSDKGSITALYTVLVEGDNLNEPLADEVRSILDGHIVLSRKLAQENHYPAIDINASISRVMHQIVSPHHLKKAGRLRQLLAAYKEVELLIRVGEYQKGQDPIADEAVARRDTLRHFLCQKTDEVTDFTETTTWLAKAVG